MVTMSKVASPTIRINPMVAQDKTCGRRAENEKEGIEKLWHRLRAVVLLKIRGRDDLEGKGEAESANVLGLLLLAAGNQNDPLGLLRPGHGN